MNSHGLFINTNLTVLSKLTDVSLRLVDRCKELKLFTPDETDFIAVAHIHSIKSNIAKRFYIVVMMKDASVFMEIINVMQEPDTHQAEDVIDILIAASNHSSDQRPIDQMVILSTGTMVGLRLLDKCNTAKIISNIEKERINSTQDGYPKAMKFYDLMMRKDLEDIIKLIEIMKEDTTKQSDQVINILRNYTVGYEPNQISSSVSNVLTSQALPHHNNRTLTKIFRRISKFLKKPLIVNTKRSHSDIM